jgi:integrative and conjugative element protein (TIGR02256 family)
LASRNKPAWNPQPCNRTFRSADAKYAVVIPRDELLKILQFCLVAGKLETGGILVGHYSRNHDVAHVSDASGPPKDSKSGTTWFRRGLHGLQGWLLRLWKDDRFYLGEWHFHPGARPSPSSTDTIQIKEISDSLQYNCPEPVLLIIGGNLPEAWEVEAYASPRSGSVIRLENAEIDAEDD